MAHYTVTVQYVSKQMQVAQCYEIEAIDRMEAELLAIDRLRKSYSIVRPPRQRISTFMRKFLVSRTVTH